MPDSLVSARLRELKESRRLTARQMAEQTGIPVRTLESYMRKEAAPLPGVDALVRLANGLDIPLDWLLLGNDVAAERVFSFTHFSVDAAARSAIRGIYQTLGRDADPTTVKVEAGNLATEAAEIAQFLVLKGVASLSLALMQISDQAQLNADLKAKLKELGAELGNASVPSTISAD